MRTHGSRAVEIAAVYGAATPPGKLALALDTAVEALAAEAAVVRIDLHAELLPIAGTRAEDEATQRAVEAERGPLRLARL